MNQPNYRLIELPQIADTRGALTYLEQEQHIPFKIGRLFYLYDLPADAIRGGHAHREQTQFTLVLNGACEVHLDDGKSQDSLILRNPREGLLVLPRTWSVLKNFEPGTVILIMTSGPYQEEEFIWNYEEL